MNSTFNVNLTTRNNMITELEKAMEITKHIMEKGQNSTITWKRLFKKFPFFKAYQYFIEIQILSKTEDHHNRWKGRVESLVKQLLLSLNRLNDRTYKCLEFRPWPKSYNLGNRVDDEAGGYPWDDTYYFGIRVKKLGDVQKIDLTEARVEFFNFVNMLISDRTRKDYDNFYSLLESKQVDIGVRLLTRDQLPDAVRP